MVKVSVVKHNFIAADQYYLAAAQIFSDFSGGAIKVNFDLQGHPAVEMPLQDNGSFFSIDFDWINAYFPEGRFFQLIYDYNIYPHYTLACARKGDPGKRQLSQINGIGPGTDWQIVHELCHSFNFFLGIEDTVHAIIVEEGNNVERAFRRIIGAIAPYANQLDAPQETPVPQPLRPRFPLPHRIPIYNSGWWSWRTDPRDGRKFRHYAQDYRASNTPLFAPEDGVVSSYRETLGGLWIKLVTANLSYEIAHNARVIKTGPVKRGDLIGVAGDTNRRTWGQLNSGAHAHIQIINLKDSGRINPEEISWDEGVLTGMYLGRNSRGEISLFTGKQRHPIAAQSYAELFDSADYIQVDDGFYAAVPVGRSFSGISNLGKIEGEADEPVIE